MGEKTKKEIELHSAGATIRHRGRFSELESYTNTKEIDQDFINTWVIPFYMSLNKDNKEWIDKISGIFHQINDEIILKNLGDFNWRTRQTGAFFAAIKDKKEYTDIIGTHLLKSEVCYAGRQYAITLSYFNTQKAIDYLEKYLDYYLLHPELPFDQYAVIAAVKYLDEVNGTNNITKHLKAWKKFLENGKKLQYKNHKSLINSNLLPEEAKQKLSEISYDNDIDYSISTDHIDYRIKTIKTIINNI